MNDASQQAAPPGPLAQAEGERRGFFQDFGAEYAANGLIGFMFAATGPVAIVISTGTQGGLSAAQLASFMFGIFFVNGLITVGMSWWYRQPLCLFWTIPGTVLVGPSLQHFSYAEVIGAFYATALLIFLLGVSGLVGRAMRVVPMPIVIGMVAGVLLRFGLDLVRALIATWRWPGRWWRCSWLLSAIPALGRRLPPLIGALVAGARPRRGPRAVRRGGAWRAAMGAPVDASARMVAGGDGGVGGSARHHGAGGAERPGFRGLAGGRAPAAGHRRDRALWRRLGCSARWWGP